jgi:hypothetical protein
MNAKIILNKIMRKLQMEVKLETMELTDGTVLEADVFEPDAEIFVLSGENRVALPVGEYTLADGRVLIVVEEGIIAEIREAAAPEEEAPAPEEEVAAEETKPKKIVESISQETFFAEIKKINDKIDALNLAKEEKTEEKEEEKTEEKTELKEEEKQEKVKHSPESEVKKKYDFHQPQKNKSRKQRILEQIQKK